MSHAYYAPPIYANIICNLLMYVKEEIKVGVMGFMTKKFFEEGIFGSYCAPSCLPGAITVQSLPPGRNPGYPIGWDGGTFR
jgi:hypothetical protein